MGGEVLELLNDRAERLEREARQEGLKRGLEQGMEQGLEQGMAALAEQLRSRGVSDDLIAQAIEGAKSQRCNAGGKS